MEKVYKVKTAIVLPFGVKQWQALFGFLVIMMTVDPLREVHKYLAVASVALGFATIVLLMRLEELFPGRSLPQYIQFFSQADEYVVGRDRRPPPPL